MQFIEWDIQESEQIQNKQSFETQNNQSFENQMISNQFSISHLISHVPTILFIRNKEDLRNEKFLKKWEINHSPTLDDFEELKQMIISFGGKDILQDLDNKV